MLVVQSHAYHWVGIRRGFVKKGVERGGLFPFGPVCHFDGPNLGALFAANSDWASYLSASPARVIFILGSPVCVCVFFLEVAGEHLRKPASRYG